MNEGELGETCSGLYVYSFGLHLLSVITSLDFTEKVQIFIHNRD
jgi:hypothetical protein